MAEELDWRELFWDRFDNVNDDDDLADATAILARLLREQIVDRSGDDLTGGSHDWDSIRLTPAEQYLVRRMQEALA